jgi:hypothetical protein
MENYFKGFTIEYIERTKNAEAVELAKAAARHTSLPADVFFSSDIRCIHQDSCGGAKGDQFDTGRRLACANNGIPSPLL